MWPIIIILVCLVELEDPKVSIQCQGNEKINKLQLYKQYRRSYKHIVNPDTKEYTLQYYIYIKHKTVKKKKIWESKNS